MLNFPALDVAIGLIFVFFVLALTCSGINEAIAGWARWRAQDLERGLWELLQDPERGEKAAESLELLKAHPLIQPMLYPANKATAAASPPLKDGRPKTSRKTDFPSYIPSRTFAVALLGIGQKAVGRGADVRAELRSLDESINAIPSDPVRRAMTAILHDAQGDAVRFRHGVEHWYDDQMGRVSGWYKKRVQTVLWILAIVIALVLNADALQMAKRLWVEPSVRSAFVNEARNATTSETGQTSPARELERLPVPLGWHLASSRHDPQGFPFYEKWSTLWALLAKLIGLSVTAVAITFGAPFWFDLLTKLARLRSGGAPPPPTGALPRGGEGTPSGEAAPPPPKRRPRRPPGAAAARRS